MMRSHREIAVAIVIDRSGQFLLQQRDDIPGILYPGKVGLFGGHREGNETFLECVVRELHEELSYFIPPHQFVPLLTYDGKYWGPEGGTLRAEFYVVRDIPRDQITVTEGTLLVADLNAVLGDLQAKMAPSATLAFRTYAQKQGRAVKSENQPELS